jgi:hypothetical protein
VKAGTYYIGDLCYVLGDDDATWAEVRNHIQTGGEHCLSNGTEIAVYSTHYGDGVYEDNAAHGYTVDSGSLGCVRVEDLTDGADTEGGRIVTFAEDFSTYKTPKAAIVFGHIRISTGLPDRPSE